jgi:hypothetical protein
LNVKKSVKYSMKMMENNGVILIMSRDVIVKVYAEISSCVSMNDNVEL